MVFSSDSDVKDAQASAVVAPRVIDKRLSNARILKDMLKSNEDHGRGPVLFDRLGVP